MPMPKSNILSGHVDEDIVANTVGVKFRVMLSNSISRLVNFYLSVIRSIRNRFRGFATSVRRRGIDTILSEMTIDGIDGDGMTSCDCIFHLKIIVHQSQFSLSRE